MDSREAVIAESVETVSRSGSVASRHGSASSSKKKYTPTKQISLTAAKHSIEKHEVYVKKMDNKHAEKIVETSPRPYNCLQENFEEPIVVPDTRCFNSSTLKVSLQTQKNTFAKAENSALSEPTPVERKHFEEQITNPVFSTEVVLPHSSANRVHRGLSETSGEESSDEESESEEEEEKGKAPMQLLGEFLKATMEEDYKLANKLCTMILIYEPDNLEAKEFFPLIEKMMLIDEQTKESDEDEETDESDDETSDSEDDSESDDETSDENSEESSESDEHS
ncbi:glutamate-rich protein 2 isoform X2 [Protopterus annectens]|nr:glutamate-rich protein 2 isoform X2 [Protopterus annectens]